MLEKELATTATVSYLVDKGDEACSTDCLTTAVKMVRSNSFEALIILEELSLHPDLVNLVNASRRRGSSSTATGAL